VAYATNQGLSAEKASKLIFIYMNRRVLEKAGDLLLVYWVERSDDEQVSLEDFLLVEENDEDEGKDLELDEERQVA
jgi:hypothetical protein